MGRSDDELGAAGDWLKRLLLQLVDGAFSDTKVISVRPDAALHRLRVRMKTAGALLYLGKAVVDKPVRKELRGRMRKVKHACASQRDATVVAELADRLGKEHGLHFIQPRTIIVAPSAQKIRSLLSALRRELAALPLDGLTWDDTKDGYADMYKACRQWMRKARKTDVTEDFHEWRKRVKALYYQMQALHSDAPHQQKRLERTKKLGHLLGCEHDLTLLEAQTNAQAPGSPWQDVIAKHRKKLRARILKLGEKFFEQPPHRFARLRRVPAAC